MANKKQPVDFEALLSTVDAAFPMVQILDKDGKVVNKDITDDLNKNDFLCEDGNRVSQNLKN